MRKKLLLILIFIVCFFEQSKSQTQAYQIDTVKWDDLYKKITYVPNSRDTIFLYEKLINDKISSAIKSIRSKSDTSISKEIKSRFLEVLSQIQKTYIDFIDNETRLLFLSYGSFYGGHERGEVSGYFQVYLLKKEYFYVSAIIDNALANFIQGGFKR